METPTPKPIALRWIGGHVAGMVAVQLLILALPPIDLRGLPGSMTWADLVRSLAQSIEFTVGQLAAILWVGWPVRITWWGPTSVLSVLAGGFPGSKAMEAALPALLPGIPVDSFGHHLALFGSGVLVFLTAACFLAVPQAFLVGRTAGRVSAIHWGAWTTAAWVAAEFASNAPIWFAREEFQIWPLDERWIVGPVLKALWAAIFAVLRLPALRRMRQIRSTSCSTS